MGIVCCRDPEEKYGKDGEEKQTINPDCSEPVTQYTSTHNIHNSSKEKTKRKIHKTEGNENPTLFERRKKVGLIKKIDLKGISALT
jgi:hypothetical protein